MLDSRALDFNASSPYPEYSRDLPSALKEVVTAVIALTMEAIIKTISSINFRNSKFLYFLLNV